MSEQQAQQKFLSFWQAAFAVIAIFVTSGASFGVLLNRVANLEEKNTENKQRIEKLVENSVKKEDLIELKNDVKDIRRVVLEKNR